MLLIAALLLAACGGTTEQPALSQSVVYSAAQVAPRTDFLGYRDDAYPFELRLPREWYLGQLDSEHYGLVVASSNDSSQPRAAISILVEPMSGGAELNQAVSTAEGTLQSQASISAFELDLARPASVNAMEGQERLYRYTLDGKRMRQRTVYLRDAEQLYAISLIAPEDIYAHHEAIYNDVLASFRSTLI